MKTITEVRIVEAAVQLFSRQGFNGTGTREIARLAEVNEATLFRCYGRKRDLFWASLESRLSRLKLDRELQSCLAREEEPAVVLPMILKFIVRTIVEQPELMRLLYFAALELPGYGDLYRKHVGSIFDAIDAYMLKCAARGKICNVDPHIATLGFLGAVIAHVNLYQLFTGDDLPFTNTEEASAAYTDFWVKLLAGSSARTPELRAVE